MPEGEPKPVEPKQPEPPPTGVWSLGYRLLGMDANAQGRAVGLALVALLVWMVLDDRDRGRKADDEFRAMMHRTVESEGVRNREANAAEGEKNRQSLKETTALIIESNRQQAQETGKLQATIVQFTAAVQEWTRQTQNLGSMIGKWKKDNEWPAPEAELAPMPKLYDRAPTGGRPTIG
jgi:hypothetical protein